VVFTNEKNLINARRVLLTVIDFLNFHNVPYHLEGGTLLGIVRSQELLPWDYDVDISIPFEFKDKLIRLRWKLLWTGYKLSAQRSPSTIGPFAQGEHFVVKIKPLGSYFLHWFIPSHKFIILDIFLKKTAGDHTYWQAKGKLMRVDSKYYSSHELVPYQGEQLRAPLQYKNYLTEKYGDWSVPVKEWNCSTDELTVVKTD
jgi:phosphorylcholine metabolism protein LicD